MRSRPWPASSKSTKTIELAEVEQFLSDKRIGPLDGFRTKAGWPFAAELVLKRSKFPASTSSQPIL